MVEYFRGKIASDGILFSQEPHSSHGTVIKLLEGFKGKLIFSHGTTNSCGVMTGYFGSNNIKVNLIKHDNQGRILIVDTDIDIDLF